MPRKLAITIFIIGLNLLSISKAKAEIGFYLGPNYSIYSLGHSYGQAKYTYGFGMQSGFLVKTNTSHIASFRCDLLFSWTTFNDKIKLISEDNYGYNSVDGQFNFYSIIFSPQVQFNILKNRGLFISSGFALRKVKIDGKGTAYQYNTSSDFNGNNFNYLFNVTVISAGLSIGYQKIKIGKLTFFGELKENFDITGITYSYYTIMPFRAFTTSITIGILLYKEKK